jgi:hypothetical protein
MLRELTIDELGHVSGGTIVVIGSPPKPTTSGGGIDPMAWAALVDALSTDWMSVMAVTTASAPGDDGGGSEVDPNSKEANTCPPGSICVPAGDAKGHFVKDTSTGKIYMTDKGWDFYNNGVDTDWAGVARDLLMIIGGGIGGAGGGLAAVAGMIGLAEWILDRWADD